MTKIYPLITYNIYVIRGFSFGGVVLQEVIYVDVLVVLNLFVNYFLLLATSFSMKEDVKKSRLFIGAFLGGMYSLIVFVPEMGFAFNTLSRIAAGALIIFAAFGFKTFRRFLRLLLSFVMMTFLFAGLMIGLWIIFRPRGMVINNSAVYFQISLPLLVASTSVCYILSKLVIRFLHRNKPQKTICRVKVIAEGKFVEGKGMLDTGNTLSEGFSGYPVVICTYDFIKSIIPENSEAFFKGEVNSLGTINDENWRKKLRVVSYNTVGDTGIMPAFQPEKLIIDDSQETEKVYIGVVNRKKYINESFDMLLNPNLF